MLPFTNERAGIDPAGNVSTREADQQTQDGSGAGERQEGRETEGKAEKVAPLYAYLYVLMDPLTDQVRYVGQTLNPKDRCRAHLSGEVQVNQRLSAWIRTLKKGGRKPVFQVVGKYHPSAILQKEAELIGSYRDLFNSVIIHPQRGFKITVRPKDNPSPSCTHKSGRLHAWHAGDVLCVACCDCGTVLMGGTDGHEQASAMGKASAKVRAKKGGKS